MGEKSIFRVVWRAVHAWGEKTRKKCINGDASLISEKTRKMVEMEERRNQVIELTLAGKPARAVAGECVQVALRGRAGISRMSTVMSSEISYLGAVQNGGGIY